MIGADFDKINFSLWGLELLEPMGFITDLIMGSTAIFLGLTLLKLKQKNTFNNHWMWFYLIFGIGSILGGFSHLLYNYLGLSGKVASWVFIPTAIYFLEQAMISVNYTGKNYLKLKRYSFWKLVLVYIVFFLTLNLADLSSKPEIGFLPIAINTIIGVSFAAGILGFYYSKKITPLYRYFYWGVLIIFPTAFIFLMKINLHQWFDKNDLSHTLITFGIICFFFGIKKIASQNNNSLIKDV